MSGKRVAVIGAGPSGLTAIKSLREVGLNVVCYERCGTPGGLWRYHEDDIDGVASVMRTTVINTSKENSAFSDFPPPADFPNYMHNRQMHKYFSLYAEHFNLLKFIRYYLEVIKIDQKEDFDTTGRWVVTVRSTKTAAISKEEFDGVLVCIGHHVYPKVPSFPGQKKFLGNIIHTHSLKSCDQFVGQRVVVVGIGNSGVDAAVDCTYTADQVYLSTRRGSWIFSRVGPNGIPFDYSFNSRRNSFFNFFRTYNGTCEKLEKFLNSKFDHEVYNLKPKHRVLSAHPTMNDNLPNCILTGRVLIRGDILGFEENGVVFAGENEVTQIDSVILATGYRIQFPFLDQNLIKTEDNRVHLYKYSVPPSLKHPTLAIIGLIQPIGPIFPCSEMQSRWFAQVLAGHLKLPSVKEMEKDIACKHKEMLKRYVASTRHTIQVDWIKFMDELADMIGVKPNMWKLALTDPKLFLACFSGPCLPYQYRLQGPYAWPGARKAILSLEDRVFSPLNSEGKRPSEFKSTHTGKGWFIVITLAIIVGCTYKRHFHSIS